MPAYVFIPADLETAKIDHALAYGATVVPIEGTYDDVNRLCLEIAGETGWGFVNINLRPFYAEGSKTLAFEIAEALGWRAPDVIVAPIASGAMYTKLAKGFDELAEVGLIERTPIRFVGGQPAGCGPVATAWANGTTEIVPIRTPDTIVRSLAIGNPADGRYAVELAVACGGSIEAIDDFETARAIRQVACARGDLSGDCRRRHAGRSRRGSTARRDPRRRRGRRASDRERPQDARRAALRHRWCGGRAGPPRDAGPCRTDPAQLRGLRAVAGVGLVSSVRIPPVLRAQTGGAKQVDVPGSTVREVLGGLVTQYPGLSAQILGPGGELNRFVNVFLNDTDVRHLQDLDTAVDERDSLVLLPAMAGG